MESAQAGDLVLILGDAITRCWKQIIYFNAEGRPQDTTGMPPSTIELPQTEGFSLDDSMEIIRDERGVRIAREEGD